MIGHKIRLENEFVLCIVDRFRIGVQCEYSTISISNSKSLSIVEIFQQQQQQPKKKKNPKPECTKWVIIRYFFCSAIT